MPQEPNQDLTNVRYLFGTNPEGPPQDLTYPAEVTEILKKQKQQEPNPEIRQAIELFLRKISEEVNEAQQQVLGEESGGISEMPDEQWLKLLLEKMDQDRRDSEKRIQDSVSRIEDLMGKQAQETKELMSKQAQDIKDIRKEISEQRKENYEQNERMNDRINSSIKDNRYFLIGTFIAITALVVSASYAFIQIVSAIKVPAA